jgi:hypothetical protein
MKNAMASQQECWRLLLASDRICVEIKKNSRNFRIFYWILFLEKTLKSLEKLKNIFMFFVSKNKSRKIYLLTKLKSNINPGKNQKFNFKTLK